MIHGIPRWERNKKRSFLLLFINKISFFALHNCVSDDHVEHWEKTNNSLILRLQTRSKSSWGHLLLICCMTLSKALKSSSWVFPQATIFIRMFTQFSTSVLFTYSFCILYILAFLCGVEQVICFQPFHSSCSAWSTS